MKRAITFIIITCLLNWALAVAFMLAGFKFSGSQAIIFGAIYMLIPMLVALFLQKLIYKEKVKDNLLISFKLNKWFLVACFKSHAPRVESSSNSAVRRGESGYPIERYYNAPADRTVQNASLWES